MLVITLIKRINLIKTGINPAGTGRGEAKQLTDPQL